MLPKTTVRRVATEAVVKDELLEITYRKKDKNVVRRQVKPAEIKTEQHVDDYGYLKTVTYLYAYERSAGHREKHIKRWIIDQFLSMRVIPAPHERMPARYT